MEWLGLLVILFLVLLMKDIGKHRKIATKKKKIKDKVK